MRAYMWTDIKSLSPNKKMCIVCGKEFYCDVQYVYRLNVLPKTDESTHCCYFCSYGHMRLWEKKLDAAHMLMAEIRKLTFRLRRLEKEMKRSSDPGIPLEIERCKTRLNEVKGKLETYNKEAMDAVRRTARHQKLFRKKK